MFWHYDRYILAVIRHGKILKILQLTLLHLYLFLGGMNKDKIPYSWHEFPDFTFLAIVNHLILHGDETPDIFTFEKSLGFELPAKGCTHGKPCKFFMACMDRFFFD